ncbi:hypothetical protein KFL_000470020 [Klebsormidium nitens]|uniref:Uncharacterized protein n=1 Tax=Klebsormidium nitens TaxID=105231 RepID=A0A1Y1HWB1_KLENI|nr:hypothetical protein KFL_000470020 [Klebsormidium nitens]|eukprot:GAQ80128.1 hypothetical protein KFL_000470020 [Klebsormidium nitens]
MHPQNRERDLTFEEVKGHFSVWAIVRVSCPCSWKTDLVNLTTETDALFSDKEVIDVNQNKQGAHATVRVHISSELQTGRCGPVCTLRQSSHRSSFESVSITAAWADMDVPPGARVIARYCWQRVFYPNYDTGIIALGPIAPFDVILVRLEPGTILEAPQPYILLMLPPPPANSRPQMIPRPQAHTRETPCPHSHPR